jgi:hypothetical protein
VQDRLDRFTVEPGRHRRGAGRRTAMRFPTNALLTHRARQGETVNSTFWICIGIGVLIIVVSLLVSLMRKER